jgi:hypothetical protein
METLNKALLYLNRYLHDLEYEFDYEDGKYYDDGALYEEIKELRILIHNMENYINDN